MYRMEQSQAHHGIPMKDATQYDLLKGLYVTVVPVYDELGKQASNGSLMLYDDTPGRILENQAQGVNQHAKMTPLGGKTASKIDPPLRCNITAG